MIMTMDARQHQQLPFILEKVKVKVENTDPVATIYLSSAF
jgi:hypothetical protein